MLSTELVAGVLYRRLLRGSDPILLLGDSGCQALAATQANPTPSAPFPSLSPHGRGGRCHRRGGEGRPLAQAPPPQPARSNQDEVQYCQSHNGMPEEAGDRRRAEASLSTLTQSKLQHLLLLVPSIVHGGGMRRPERPLQGRGLHPPGDEKAWAPPCNAEDRISCLAAVRQRDGAGEPGVPRPAVPLRRQPDRS